MCEDSKQGRGPNGAKLVIEGDGTYQYRADVVAAERATTSTPVVLSEGIPFTPNFDLRGVWGKSSREEVTEARQLGQRGYRGLPEEAFQGTWPENPDAYAEYQEGLVEAEAAKVASRPAIQNRTEA